MSDRYQGGYLTLSYSPLKVPNPPTGATATVGDASASVSFTAPANTGDGAIISYLVVSFPGGFTNSGASSPITVSGLSNGTEYTFKVIAVNDYGPSGYSDASNAVTPFTNEWFSVGYNNQGQLAQNDKGAGTERSSPTQVGALTGWSDVSAGGSCGFAVNNGKLYAVGSNNGGQLGLNDRAYRSSPVQVGSLTNWANTSTSNAGSVLAVKTNNTLWSWGNNDYGVLFGVNTTTRRSSPVQVATDNSWATAAVGGNAAFSAAITTDGRLFMAGYNGYGQLGNNDRVYKSSPTQVGSLSTWAQVSLATYGYSVLALQTNGTMWAWGLNTVGQLGQNDRVTRSSPVQIGALTTWAEIATGSIGVCVAVKNDGTLWSWGDDGNGALGLGTDGVSRSSPVQVGSLTTWDKPIKKTFYYGAGAIKTDGSLWLWGYNVSNGPLGTNNRTSYSSPVQVGVGYEWTDAAYSDNTDVFGYWLRKA